MCIFFYVNLLAIQQQSAITICNVGVHECGCLKVHKHTHEQQTQKQRNGAVTRVSY